MSFYKEVPGLQTTLESTLKFDTTPTAGSTNPVTSGGVAEAVGGASDALQEQIDEIAEKAGSGYTPKGPASVATLNGLTGQENGWLYTMTDAGTLTDGSVAVVAGDTVAWDATNSVWYKAMDYYTKSQTDTLLAGKQHVISVVQGAPIILDANGNLDLKISDGSFLDGLPEGDGYEQIGDNFYKVGLMPDGKIWMCENLDFKFSGLVVGQGSSSSETRANYYDNDESTYGVNGNKYGLLYNWIAVKYLEDHKSGLIPGWHVPTTSEWDALATAVGGSGVAGTKLKSTTGWSSGNGDDSFGFAAFPAGGQNSGSFYGLDNYARFWTATEGSSSGAYRRNFDTGASMFSDYYDKSYGCSVRLVKD